MSTSGLGPAWVGGSRIGGGTRAAANQSDRARTARAFIHVGAIVVRQQLQWLGAPRQRHVGETTKGRIQPGVRPRSG